MKTDRKKEIEELNKEISKMIEEEKPFEVMLNASGTFSLEIFKAISKLPKEIRDWAAKNILIISACDRWACFFPKGNTRYEIFICSKFRRKSEKGQTFIIAHEIAHCKLGHKVPIIDNLSDEDALNQEKEAEKLAISWLGKDYVKFKSKFISFQDRQINWVAQSGCVKL